MKRAPNNIYAPFFRSIFVPFASRGSELELELGRLPSAGVMFARARSSTVWISLLRNVSGATRGVVRRRARANRIESSSNEFAPPASVSRGRAPRIRHRVVVCRVGTATSRVSRDPRRRPNRPARDDAGCLTRRFVVNYVCVNSYLL